MKVINQLNLNETIVLINVDLNVNKNDLDMANKKINDVLASIEYAIDQNAKVVLLSHKNNHNEELEPLINISKILADKLDRVIAYSTYSYGVPVDYALNHINYGDVLLLEPTNDENKDDALAEYWVNKCNVFINDDINSLYCEDVAIQYLTKNAPFVGVGLLFNKNLKVLETIKNNQLNKPTITILGSDLNDLKIDNLKKIIDVSDKVIVVGKAAATFLKASHFDVANSYVKNEYLNIIDNLLKTCKDKFILPIDFYCYKGVDILHPLLMQNKIDEGYCFLDIGKATVKLLTNTLKEAKTIIFDGPIASKKEGLAGMFQILKSITSFDNIYLYAFDEELIEIISSLKFNQYFKAMINNSNTLYNYLNNTYSKIWEILGVR